MSIKVYTEIDLDVSISHAATVYSKRKHQCESDRFLSIQHIQAFRRSTSRKRLGGTSLKLETSTVTLTAAVGVPVDKASAIAFGVRASRASISALLPKCLQFAPLTCPRLRESRQRSRDAYTPGVPCCLP